MTSKSMALKPVNGQMVAMEVTRALSDSDELKKRLKK